MYYLDILHCLSTILAVHVAGSPCLSIVQQRGVINVPHDFLGGYR